jgi:hypothetical protein
MQVKLPVPFLEQATANVIDGREFAGSGKLIGAFYDGRRRPGGIKT